MPQKLRQRGFAGLELMLVLGVLLLIVGIGAFVYSKNHHGGLFSKKPASSGQGTSTGTSTSPDGIPGGANSGTTTTSPPPGKTDVTVKEGSFKITVPDSMKDLTYHLLSNSGGVMTFAFSTATLTKAIPGCAATSGNGAFQTILRGSGTYPGPANPSSGGLLRQYDSYYLAYNLPNAPCAKGLSVENQNLLGDQAQEFYGSLTSVK